MSTKTKEAVIAALAAEIQAAMERNLVGAQPVSFEMYQKLAVFVWGVDEDQVAAVYHDLSADDHHALVFDIQLKTEINMVEMTFKIR